MTPSELETLAELVAKRVADKLSNRPLLVDRLELCSLLELSESTIDRMARSGEIPSIRCGRRVKFQPDEVLAALSGRRDK